VYPFSWPVPSLRTPMSTPVVELCSGKSRRQAWSVRSFTYDGLLRGYAITSDCGNGNRESG